jgi:hypothetical protein
MPTTQIRAQAETKMNQSIAAFQNNELVVQAQPCWKVFRWITTAV